VGTEPQAGPFARVNDVLALTPAMHTAWRQPTRNRSEVGKQARSCGDAGHCVGAGVKAEVASRNASGDLRVFYEDTAGWLSTGDFTDGIHPNAQGSTRAAESLAAAIRKIGLP
jgi:lysophospholipase L1-like esterase